MSEKAPRSRLRPAASDPELVTAEQAATLLLLGAGLLERPDHKAVGAATPARVAKTIEAIGFVQVDSICIIERAHHLILHNRLDAYRHDTLRDLLERQRTLFEQWTHDASIIPLRWYPHWHHRFRRSAAAIRRNHWWRERMGRGANTMLRRVREFVEENGPTASRDLVFDERKTPRSQSSAWWGWRPEKAALEYLWRSGELAVAARDNFEKVYDLSERVHPEHHATPMPSRGEHVDWACATALERLGVATAKELSDFWRGLDPGEAKKWCDRAIHAGDAVAVGLRDVSGREWHAIARPDWRERLASTPPPPDRIRLLCPFDPLVRDRARLERLFGFAYRFEAFVPKQKRVHGYYTLPVMDVEGERPRFVARLDAKHDRATGTLVVEGLWWEPGVKATRTRRQRLDEALGRLASFIGATGGESGRRLEPS